MQMAVWTRTMSPADTAYAKQQIDDLKLRLDQGDDFIELAETYTMDPSGQGTGGDLGWFGKGAMVKPFEDAVYALEVGEISDPVQTRFGWHIIRLDEERDSETDKGEREVRARHILIRPEISQETIDFVYQHAQDYAIGLREGTIEFTRETAEEAGAVWFKPSPTQRGDNLPFLGAASDVKAWLFSAEPGAVSDPIDNGDKFVVAQLIETREAGLAPLEEVRGQVQNRFILRRARELARVQADSLWQAALAGESLKELAKGENVTLTTTGLFSPTTNVANVARSPMFMGTVFSLSEENPYSDLVPVENGWVMIHVLEMQLADMNELPAVRDSLASELLQTKQSNAFTRWVTDLYERADIKDYRGEMFGT
jgi:parvulin-like peptidyl-prolyl isomerase